MTCAGDTRNRDMLKNNAGMDLAAGAPSQTGASVHFHYWQQRAGRGVDGNATLVAMTLTRANGGHGVKSLHARGMTRVSTTRLLHSYAAHPDYPSFTPHLLHCALPFLAPRTATHITHCTHGPFAYFWRCLYLSRRLGRCPSRHSYDAATAPLRTAPSRHAAHRKRRLRGFTRA